MHRKAEPLAVAAARPAAPREDVEVTAALSAPVPAKPAAPVQPKCANADALGVSRVVVVDTSGGPGFGFQQYKQLDFLTEKEVVLTFDDGPWPTTPSVLKSLAEECTKATFFPVGKHSTYHPEILKQVYAAGHTVGSHTWSHAHLDSKKLTEAQVKEEIEKGFSAIKLALGAAPAPFFRFPGLQHTPASVELSRLAQHRDVLHRRRLLRLQGEGRRADRHHRDDQARQAGQGHHPDARSAEAHRHALPALLRRLKAGGYKVVHMKAKVQLETLAEYDALLVKDMKLPAVASRPVSSVIQTVSE